MFDIYLVGGQESTNNCRQPMANRPNGYEPESDPKRSIVVIRVNFFQTELMVEISSESLVRAIDNILLMKCS